MSNLNGNRKLGRTSSHRLALLKNLANALIRFETIVTTDEKAKELRRFVERLITFGKRGDTHARRLVFGRLRDKETTTKLFEELAPKFADRQGGYTRIVKGEIRRGDAASLSHISLVLGDAPKKKATKTRKKPVAAQKAKVEEKPIATNTPVE